MKKKIGNEKGSIVIFVMVSLVFILGFIITSYMNITSRKNSTKKSLEKIKDEYGNETKINMEMKNEYESIKNIVIDENREVEKANKEYLNGGERAIIPKGFTIVPGCGNIKEGLVISDDVKDNETDKENIVSVGNQFVWIPVKNMDKFIRKQGYSNFDKQANFELTGEESLKVNEKFIESQSTQNEAKAMYNSVMTYGGFYIGRYETGTETAILKEQPKIWPDAIVKKGKEIYNNVPWSSTTVSSNDLGGAVEIARKMYTTEKYGVKSTLCYGVQWDAALNFIDDHYITNEIKKPLDWEKNSYITKGKGNYQGFGGWTYTNSGENNAYEIKNIYDMAGNVAEWTMEGYKNTDIEGRIYRGGSYNTTNIINPSSSRENIEQNIGKEDIGFRIALYIK